MNNQEHNVIWKAISWLHMVHSDKLNTRYLHEVVTSMARYVTREHVKSDCVVISNALTQFSQAGRLTEEEREVLFCILFKIMADLHQKTL